MILAVLLLTVEQSTSLSEYELRATGKLSAFVRDWEERSRGIGSVMR